MKEETRKDWIIQWVKAFTLCIGFVDADVHCGGEDPCRLMKLIISNHSSSMKEDNDEKADTHMCVLLHSTGMDKRTWAKYDVMQAINTSPIQYNVLCCIIHERFLLFCPSSVESMLLHCTYKNAASIIYTCIFGMSTNKMDNHRKPWYSFKLRSKVLWHTYSTVHISFSPYCVMLVVNDLWAAHDMKIPHHVLLNVG